MEPVVGEEGDYVLREEDWPTLEKEYETLADIYLQRQKDGWGEKFNFFHFRMDLYRGPCMAKRLRGCGAGHEYMAVVPNGDIYPCHQFVGKDGYILGNVYEGLKILKFQRISVTHMCLQNLPVQNVGLNSSALVAVMPITLHWVEIYKRLMSLAVVYKRNELNVLS